MAEVLASLKKIGGNGEQYTETVLWTNPSPTATFAAQTVTLSDSITNYKYLLIRYKDSNSGSDTFDDICVVSDFIESVYDKSAVHSQFGISMQNSGNRLRTRAVGYVSATSINFSACYNCNTSGSDNTCAIPLEILGINELAHGKQHDNSIRISHIYARLWSASNTALGGAQITLDGRDTVTVGSRDSAFTSCRCDFYAIDNTLLEQNNIPVGGGTFTAPANAYNVYIWGARSTAGQASISDIEIYKGE